MKALPKCYGGMFPDLSAVRFNTPLKGKVFDVFVSSGGMGVSDRTFSANTEEWIQCTECPDHQDCYQFSMARLLLHSVVQRYGVSPAI